MAATVPWAHKPIVLALAVALPLGVLAAVHRGRVVDALAMSFAVVGQATPYFWIKPWLELFQEVVTFEPRADYRLIVPEMSIAR